MKILTKENAPTVKVIRNIQHPEWGTKRFNYNAQQLTDGLCSTFGTGPNSAVLFDGEFRFWEVIT
jgi:hypothetical protein